MRSTRGIAGASAIAALSSVVGCQAERPSEAWSVSDSAGVEVVTSRLPGPSWTLSEEPTLSLGVVEGKGPTQFFGVTDLELLPDGRIVVANGGTEEVRIFSGRGRHLGGFGRGGNGPREFRRLSMVQTHADSLLTYDEGNDRISVWGPDGAWKRSFRLEWVSGLLVPTAFVGDRGVLTITARRMSELPGSGLIVDTALVSYYDLDGHLVDSLVRLPHNERVVLRQGNLQTTLGAPFSTFGQVVARDDDFCYAFGSVPEIRCYDLAGRLRRILRIDTPRRPVSDAHIASFWSERMEDPPGPRREAFQRMRAVMPFPSEFPAFSKLIVDDAGRLWAQVYALPDATEERWWVFREGRLAAELVSSPNFSIMDVAGDRVAGVWKDDLGVEFIQVYRVRES